jgi:hypothetical protein
MARVLHLAIGAVLSRENDGRSGFQVVARLPG